MNLRYKEILIYAAIIFGTSIIYVGLVSLPVDKQDFFRLGTVTSSGTFPAALNNFQDNDIINAGDWNHIEYAIGETGTTSPATLTYQVVNTNANNVTYSGHLTITSASTTDQTITNLWVTSFNPTNSSTTNATLTNFWSTNGQITNASTTYFSIATNGWLNGNPLVSSVTGSQTQLAAFSGTNTITPTSTISTSFISGLGTIASQNSNNVSITGGSITGITDLAVADGGTGVGTFTTNGVLYGNSTTNILVTSQGGTNSVLTANAGAPSFSDSPTILKLTATNGTFTNATSTNSLFIPQNFTLTASGQIAINTTAASTSLRFYAGGAQRAIYDTITKTITIASSTLAGAAGTGATSTINLGASVRGETWLKNICYTDTGTAGFTFTDGTNDMDYILMTSTASSSEFLTNNSFVKGEKRSVKVRSVSSNPNYLTCDILIRVSVE